MTGQNKLFHFSATRIKDAGVHSIKNTWLLSILKRFRNTLGVMLNSVQYLLVMGLFCLSLSVNAGVEPELKNYLTGSAITVGNSTVVYDQVFLDGTGAPNGPDVPGDWNLVKTTNLLQLEINQETIVDCVMPQFSVNVEIKIYAKDEFGADLAGYPKNQTFTVDYDNTVGAKYNNTHYDTFSGAFYTKIEVVSISDPVLIDYIKVGTRTIIERYKDIDLTIVPVFNNYVLRTTDSEIEFFWSAIEGAEEYDFEWAYIDNYDTTGGFYTYANVYSHFDKDATRVSIKENHYRISQIYERGFIAVRVRAVGLNGANFTHRVNGKWSYSGKKTSISNLAIGSSLVPVVLFNMIGSDVHEHEPKLTWQYAATYAEEGKKKEVISYFDGTLRNRQAVTKINTDENVIVGESIYDHVGRMAVSVLPVPAMENRLKFYANFNTSTATNQNYNYTDFDVDNGNCANPVAAMNTNSGASKYYSDDNTLSTNMHNAYLPHAYGYPFAVTEFEPDGTGRVRRQGGVGTLHQLGSGHETKYYYGTPQQQELDRLFGSGVGYAQHYQKEMVVDPNGQVSVSYKDLSGRVIATSLAGDNAPNTSALPGMTQPEAMTVSILNASTSGKPNRIEANQKFNVSKTGDHTFAYSFDVPRYTDPNAQNLCFDCVYDLTISLLDECGNELMPGGVPLTRTLGKPNSTAFDTDCELPTLSYNFTGDALLSNQNITVNLSIGSYTLSKVLNINLNALEYYEDQFLSGLNIKTEEEFINEELAKVDTVSCEMTCEECFERLGTYPDFLVAERNKIIADGGTPDAADDLNIQGLYNALKANCDALCDTNKNSCDVELAMLLADVSPGGQYAKLTIDPNTGTYDGLLDYAYYSSGQSTGYYAGRMKDGVFTKFIYTDENGNADFVEIEGAQIAPADLSTEQFIQYWKPSWADTLVTLHPEYCKYEACVTRQTSEDYDKGMLQTTTYAAALAAGYLNPLNTNANFTYVAVDPFFASGGVGNTSLAAITNVLNSYQNPEPANGNCRAMSAWELPLSFYVCKKADCSQTLTCLSGGWTQTSCAPYLDRMWQMFRAIYLAEKGKIKESLSATCATNLNGRQSRYYSYSNISSLLGGDPNSESSIRNHTLTGIADQCDTLCASQAQHWYRQLAGCNLSTADSAYLISEFIAICKGGCDANNPMGSSNMPNSALTSNNNNSFRDAFNALNLTRIPGICDINLIESPRAYGYDYAGGNGFNLDKCDSFFLKHVPTCLQSETDEEIKKALVYEIIAQQDSIECKDCIDCKQLFNGVTALLSEYDINFFDSSYEHQKVAGSFLNQYFNFNLTYYDYAHFAKKCLEVDSSFDTTSWLRYYYDHFWSTQFPTAYQSTPFQRQTPQYFGPLRREEPIMLYASLNALPPPPAQALVPLDTCACNVLSQFEAVWDNLPNPKPNFNTYVEGQITPCEQAPGTINYAALLSQCEISFTGNPPAGSLGNWNYTQTAALKASVKAFDLEVPDCIPCPGAENFIANEIDDDCPKSCAAFLNYASNYNQNGCTGMQSVLADLANGHSKISDPGVDTNCLRQFIQDFHTTFPDQYPCSPNDPRIEAYTADELGNRSFESFIRKYGHCLMEYSCDASITHPEDDSTCCFKRNGNDSFMQNFLNQMATTNNGLHNMFGYNSSMGDPMYPILDKYYNAPLYNGSACSTSLNIEGFLGVLTYGSNLPSNNLGYNNDFYKARIEDNCGFNAELNLFSRANVPWNIFPWIVEFDSTKGYADGCLPTGNFRTFAIYMNPWTGDYDSTWICGHYNKMTYHDTCKGPKYTLCNRGAFDIGIELDSNPCLRELQMQATYNGKRIYEAYMDSLRYDFRSKYLTQCREVGEDDENFTRSYMHQEYHYTLYYYDQAGNLEQTVPPAGVQLLSSSATTQVHDNRKVNGTPIYPNHSMQTEYTFNTLNQLVWQETPDGGASQFWYDNLGRLIASQNAKQALNDEYSYTFFDALGRVTEVGQVNSDKKYKQTHAITPTDLNNASVSNGTLTKTGTYGWNAGGASQETLSGDGYLEWTLDGNETSSDLVMLGLSYSNPNDQYYTIKYAFYLNNNKYYIWESGAGIWTPGMGMTPSAGDKLRIEREGYFIKYYVNGVLKRTTTESSSGSPMLADFSMVNTGAHIYKLDLVSKPTIRPVDLNNISVSNGTLTKTGTYGWNGGGASKEKIVKDGYLEWTLDGNETASDLVMLGLSYSNPDDQYFSVKYAFYLNANRYYIWESGVGIFTPNMTMTPAAGDQLRIEREGNSINYYVNGVLKRTTTESDPGSPMLADFSLVNVGAHIHKLKLVSHAALNSEVRLKEFVCAGIKEQVTQSFYDAAKFAVNYNGFTQENLRKRVVGMTFEQTDDGDDLTYDYGIHYTYDIHSMVPSMVRENQKLAGTPYASLQFRKMDYDFDLHSGKVNAFAYQKGKADQYLHEYTYDADLRIQSVHSGTTEHYLDNEVTYLHYLHGPVKRIELGELKVQGQDYAYTLHGAIKGINSGSLLQNQDIGKDGMLGQVNEKTARDVYGFGLEYYDGDYTAIGKQGGSIAQTDYFMPETAGSGYAAATPDLYNGNITRMLTALKPFMGPNGEAQGMAYSYDQLNRISTAEAWNNIDVAGNKWSAGGTALAENQSSYTYDANGNILTLTRTAKTATGAAPMDVLAYHYTPGTNRLEYVDDGVVSTAFTKDIDDQSAGNYVYDAIGNLTQDIAEEIAEIKWTLSGKIAAVIRTGTSTKPDLEFEYDPMGIRTLKRVIEKDPITAVPTGVVKEMLYIRDGSGNEMATYALENNDLTWKSSSIYGSRRVGVYEANKVLRQNGVPVPPDVNDIKKKKRGWRKYELSNHLGNVLAVVSDKRTSVCDPQNNIAYYEAELVMAQDYLPFGMAMEGRTYQNENYRFGFEGIENDREISEGGIYDFKYRMHDARLGRFLSVDPLAPDYSWNSSYAFAENRVIDGIDLEGLEVTIVSGYVSAGAVVKVGAQIGVIIAQDGIYCHVSPEIGVELGASVYAGVVTTRFSTMNSYKDALGSGGSVGVSAGEGIVGGFGLAYSGEYGGTYVSIGAGVEAFGGEVSATISWTFSAKYEKMSLKNQKRIRTFLEETLLEYACEDSRILGEIQVKEFEMSQVQDHNVRLRDELNRGYDEDGVPLTEGYKGALRSMILYNTWKINEKKKVIKGLNEKRNENITLKDNVSDALETITPNSDATPNVSSDP